MINQSISSLLLRLFQPMLGSSVYSSARDSTLKPGGRGGEAV